ncbi:hypothetical protein FIBSPDRAFT_905419 [Athelia psychrophila]|uniref:LigT-like protein n=1 Tax=Athelia psychrophila TaxID=1759441 RepID=A0A167TGU4_9AGAM|nr:hypothetical protein FIBSPDRAFT_905419 [Fibularhizoctonia sp. CBS 109695]
MPSRSCSITLEIDRDADYHFLNNLRTANGFKADNAAHISLVNRLQLSWARDSDSTAVAALERQLQAVAYDTLPFDFAYIEMDPYRPFGRGGGCVAVAVRSPAYLKRVVTNLETMTQFAWRREHRDFQPHLTISPFRSAQRSVAGYCNSRTHVRGGPLTGRATGLELWEHRRGKKYRVRVFKFPDGENVVVRRESRAWPLSITVICGLVVLTIVLACYAAFFCKESNWNIVDSRYGRKLDTEAKLKPCNMQFLRHKSKSKWIRTVSKSESDSPGQTRYITSGSARK